MHGRHTGGQETVWRAIDLFGPPARAREFLQQLTERLSPGAFTYQNLAIFPLEFEVKPLVPRAMRPS
jgi:hypothetical protein